MSEINLINKKAGIAPATVSEEAIFVLKQAKEFAKLTDGNFDPTIGPLVKVWNINGENPKVPNQKKIDEAMADGDHTAVAYYTRLIAQAMQA